MSWIGFDIGGTFTDLVLVDFESERVYATKTPSNRKDPGTAAVAGIRELLEMSGQAASDVSRIVHGTTIATNALIEEEVARVGFLCNRGFRDVVEIGRMFRDELYDINFTKTRPLVPRNLRKEINARVASDDTELVSLDEAEVTDAVSSLLDAGVDAFAVGFLHSYAFPEMELRVRKAILRANPEAVVSLSHEVSQEYGEYERWTSAIVNAALMPAMRAYLQTIEKRFADLGISSPVEVMQSNGGVVPVDVAARFPIRLLESGPAGGVVGMARLGALAGLNQIITFDMGGTSTDVCVVRAGKPALSTERKVSGQPVRAVMADIHSIGAGGGSYARLDASNTLHVGPESAGADPGPVALSQGGTSPTITDADIVLGYINPDRYCAGRYALDHEAARQAMMDVVGKPTGTTPEQAALGVLNLAVRKMAGAIRKITTQRGLDPREYALVASGGAGPVHAGLVARELRIPAVVVPAYPALLSAQGMLFADYRTDASKSMPSLLSDIDLTALNEALQDLETTAEDFLASGDSDRGFVVERVVEMCYEGQQHGVTLPLHEGQVTATSLEELARSLDQHFARHYGFIPEHNVPKLLNLRVIVEKQTESGESLTGLTVREESITEAPSRSARRMVFDEYPQGVETPVLDRVQLEPRRIGGPAVIEEDFSTIVVYPGQHAEIDDSGNVVITLKGAS